MFGIELPGWALKALLLAGVAAAGFAGAEVYEHRVPWGLEAQRDAARKADQADADSVKNLTADRDKWKTADGQCEKARTTDRNAAAAQVGTDYTQQQADSSTAFNQGYFAGKVAGAKTCPTGGTNGTTSSASPATGGGDGGGAGAGGVPDGPDFADLFGRPPEAPKPVPAGGGGADPH